MFLNYITVIRTAYRYIVGPMISHPLNVHNKILSTIIMSEREIRGLEFKSWQLFFLSQLNGDTTKKQEKRMCAS